MMNDNIKLRVTFWLEGERIDEHLVDPQTRVTMGSDRRGNLVTWMKLPRQLPLIEPRAGTPHLIPHADYPLRVHREGQPPALISTILEPLALEPGACFELELDGARVRVDLIDLDVLGEVDVPPARRRVGSHRATSAISGVVGALALSSIGLAALGAGLAERAAQRQEHITERAPRERAADVSRETVDAPREIASGEDATSAPELAPSEPMGPTARPPLPAPLQREAPELDDGLAASRGRVTPAATEDRLRSSRERERPAVTASADEVIGLNTTAPLRERAGDAFGTARRYPKLVEVVAAPRAPRYQTDLIPRRHFRRFKYCYESFLERDTGQGSVKMHFVVSRSGRVTSVEVEEDTVGGDLSPCLVRQLKRIRFPAQDERVASSVRMLFSPGEE